MAQCLRDGDVLARMGADEFGDAGGKMTQQRTLHDLRGIAIAHIAHGSSVTNSSHSGSR